jgi:hypothetical protein
MTSKDEDTAKFIELVQAHNAGEITIWQIAQVTGLSIDEAYDIVGKIYAENDISGHDVDAAPTFSTSEHFEDENDADEDEFRRRAEAAERQLERMFDRYGGYEDPRDTGE